MRVEKFLFGPLFAPAVHSALSGHPSLNPSEVVRDTWDRYDELRPSIPKQKNVGAALIVRGAAFTVAFNRALLAHGFDRATAEKVTTAATWKIYRVMGKIPWLLAGVVSRDSHWRLLLSTRLFRRFPFGPPSYMWKDAASDSGVVAFDCLRCPVAEFFKSQNEAGLCVATFCQLDFPLAAEWKAKLVRTGSIAGGSERCDFRWRTLPTQRPSLKS